MVVMNNHAVKADIIQGDCKETLKDLHSGSVQCAITSPPYYGLRSYGENNFIGLEKTPSEYIESLVQVMREVKRVLKDDGVLWINIGDSYAGSMGGSFKSDKAWESFIERSKLKGYSPGVRARTEYQRTRMNVEGCKPKDLIGIPWMLAFALRDDGWYLRQDIIWQKTNPIPEPVRDRCTTSHEYIFLLSKSRKYKYNGVAIKEPTVDGKKLRNKRSVWTVATKTYKKAHFAVYPQELIEPCVLAGSDQGDTILDPFNGSGTTGVTALTNGRNYIGCELNKDYVNITNDRMETLDIQKQLRLF